MRSVNALTCLATLGAISSVSAGPFSWLHSRQEVSAPVTSDPITTKTTSDADASLTVDGKNVSVAQLYAYLNGTSAFNVTSWLNSTANATHSITFDAESETEADEVELELTYSEEGEAVLSFLNGTQLCQGEEACREIVGEELGLTSEEITDAEECADEIEEDEEECDDDEEEDDEDEECEDGEYEDSDESETSSQAPASSSAIANNWNVDSGSASPTATAATRSNVWNVAAATNVASDSDFVPTSTATSYMYVTSGAPAGATGTPFPSASGVAQDQDDSTVTVTQYVTITVDRFIVGPSDAATTYLSTSAPAATSGNNVGNNFAASSAAQAESGVAGVSSTYGASAPVATGSYDSPDSPDTPDTPDTPDSPDSADDGYGNIEDCEEDEEEEIPEDEDEDDEEWECTEEEIDGEGETVDVSEYYNSTDCQAILSFNATDANATFVDLMAWCSNITSSDVPASATSEVFLSATETATTEPFAWSSEAPAASEAATSASSTETWSAESTPASLSESASVETASETASSETASETEYSETASETASTEAVTSYVDVYATEYVQPSASASSSADVAEATGETLSRRLANGFRRVRRSHVGRNAFV